MLTFHEKYQNDIEFKIKVIIGHILVSKVFLDPYFEKYYINFLWDSQFSQENFRKSIWYIDMMFYGDNYKDRYSLFESRQDTIINLLLSQDEISQSIKESLIWDIINIIAKKDERGNNILTPYDLDFLDDEPSIKLVRRGINSFIWLQMAELKSLLYSLKSSTIKSDLIKKMIQIMW